MTIEEFDEEVRSRIDGHPKEKEFWNFMVQVPTVEFVDMMARLCTFYYERGRTPEYVVEALMNNIALVRLLVDYPSTPIKEDKIEKYLTDVRSLLSVHPRAKEHAEFMNGVSDEGIHHLSDIVQAHFYKGESVEVATQYIIDVLEKAIAMKQQYDVTKITNPSWKEQAH